MFSYKDKKILVLGTGISGQGVAVVLKHLGAHVILNDKKEIDTNNIQLQTIKDMGIEIITGKQDSSLLKNVDRIVVSPGIPLTIEILENAKKQNISIVSEVEVAYDICKAPILGITGTNGKTTTTMLLNDVINACGVKSIVGGNIGKSLSIEAEKIENDKYLVAELSSYQLESIDEFRPHGAIFLNLAPDHLQRHKTMEAYGSAKANIIKNQTKDNIVVLNKDDEYVRQLADKTDAKVLFISQKEKVKNGAYIEGEKVFIAENGKETQILTRSDIQLRGKHNVENVLAVIALTYFLELPLEGIKKGIKAFESVEHRTEIVCKKNGITYINDSKGTNTAASLKAVEVFDEPMILILGGYDKGEDLKEFLKTVSKRAKMLIFMGDSADRFEDEAKKLAIRNFVKVGDMQTAVKAANEIANCGDVILLSPACSSFDLYRSFEERGNHFKEIVMQ